MSQRPVEPPTQPHPQSKAGETSRRSVTLPDTSHLETTDRLDGRKAPQMSEARASGELEGSTLGSSSRDGDKSRASRRTQNSGGFLLDSTFLPRSKSLRQNDLRPRRSDSDRKVKHDSPESEIVVPKKRSRFPWGRRKEHLAESSRASSSVPSEEPSTALTEPSQAQQDVASQVPQATGTGGQAPPVGLDRDSLQIVNLALNLSESRKMGGLGRSASHRVSGGRWVSGAHSTGAFPESQPPMSGGFGVDNSHARRNFTQPSGDDNAKIPGSSHLNQTPNAHPSVLPFLPPSADSNPLPHGISDSTLARAEKARRHFDLFAEYLRLLPSLPPLQAPDGDSVTDTRSTDKHAHGRSYNPLQSIRNRKVRFRERCPIDAETYGWTDVERVREWVDSIEVQYSGQTHSPFECLKLPYFRPGTSDIPGAGVDEDEFLPGSPPSSLRRASRTSSVKTRRPRSDWVISPAELIADVAWLEDGENKSKAVDKEGNNLYPDPTALFSSDVNFEPPRLPGPLPDDRHSMDAEQPASRTSTTDGHHRLSTEFKAIGRGRRRHRLQSPTRLLHGQSGSDIDTRSGRHRFRRSRSSASLSDSALDEKHHWGSGLDHTKSPRRSMSSARKGLAHVDTSASRPYQYRKSGRRSRADDKSSISSVPSLEDRYDPLTYYSNKETRDPQTPLPVGYFPSIASNLSPPSSRSPSPSKHRFSRAIAARRDRSKSDPRLKELGEEPIPETGTLSRNNTTSVPEAIARTGRLEPSPLPDRVSSVYQEERTRPSMHSRKGSMQESKLRGIFKGPGKIAEKVGNEVSKMGGLIMKKDTLAHSRQSSFATSFASDDENAPYTPDEPRGDTKQDSQTPSLRIPLTSEQSMQPLGKDSDTGLGKSHPPTPSPFTSPSRERAGDIGLADVESPSVQVKSVQGGDESRANIEPLSPQRNRIDNHPSMMKADKALGFGPELHTIREQIKRGRIRDPTVPYSLTRPPITGLAQAKASHSPDPRHRDRDRDITPSGQSRSWSISDRSIAPSINSGVPRKREVERSRALLLSSGIKAREITRRSECVRDPPSEFLLRAFSDTTVPRVPRLREYDVAVDHLLKNFEISHNRFQQSIGDYPSASLSSLKSQLTTLEDLVNNSLNPRVRAAADDAENLSVQLNTTSTLAVKQLSDTLDKGIRKRHRRLRWIRRTGFVMLEWALVGALWWVWLIVMVFKVFRGIFRGAISGIRWILWM